MKELIYIDLAEVQQSEQTIRELRAKVAELQKCRLPGEGDTTLMAFGNADCPVFINVPQIVKDDHGRLLHEKLILWRNNKELTAKVAELESQLADLKAKTIEQVDAGLLRQIAQRGERIAELEATQSKPVEPLGEVRIDGDSVWVPKGEMAGEKAWRIVAPRELYERLRAAEAARSEMLKVARQWCESTWKELGEKFTVEDALKALTADRDRLAAQVEEFRLSQGAIDTFANLASAPDFNNEEMAERPSSRVRWMFNKLCTQQTTIERLTAAIEKAIRKMQYVTANHLDNNHYGTCCGVLGNLQSALTPPAETGEQAASELTRFYWLIEIPNRHGERTP